MSEIQAVQAYRTPDGKTFPTVEEAHQHWFRSQFIDRAKRYTAARGLEKSAATRAHNIICDYLAFERVQAQQTAPAA